MLTLISPSMTIIWIALRLHLLQKLYFLFPIQEFSNYNDADMTHNKAGPLESLPQCLHQCLSGNMEQDSHDMKVTPLPETQTKIYGVTRRLMLSTSVSVCLVMKGSYKIYFIAISYLTEGNMNERKYNCVSQYYCRFYRWRRNKEEEKCILV